jgi:hypothetical protein
MGRYRESKESKALKGTLRPSRERKKEQEYRPFTDVSAIDIPADLPKQAQAIYHATSGNMRISVGLFLRRKRALRKKEQL